MLTPEQLVDELLDSKRMPVIADRLNTGRLSVRGNSLGLRPLTSPAISLHDGLRQRTALRQFSNRSITSAEVGCVLAACSVGLHELIELVLLAWRVEYIPSALYTYIADTNAVVRLGPAPDRTEVNHLLRQHEFAAAAAILIATGRLDAALAHEAEHGYRRLLLAAGAALHRGWIAAVRVGIGGCLFEPPFLKPLRHCTPDFFRVRVPLFALALGHP